MLIKLDFQEIDFRKQKTDLVNLAQEIRSKTEWSCFNDELVASENGNWHGIIEKCIELSCFPSVLFFERLDADEDYEQSKDFNLSSLQLDQLLKKAKKHDILNSGNIEDIYGPETIEKQKAIELELN